MRRTAGIAALLALLLGAGAAQAAPMRFDTRSTGFAAGEPTLGVLSDGSIVVQAYEDTIKSTDDGRTWRSVHQPPTGAISLDPYVHVDARTDRILASQLLGACQVISLSDDGGATWRDLTTQCGTTDHQKLGSGPWTASAMSPLFGSAVYSCVNHVADTACAVSADGGVTWGPLVTAFPGVDPAARRGVGGVPGFCGGLEGDPFVGRDGTLYLPREHCGRPFLGISRDNGLTWERVQVGGPSSEALPIGFGANNPSVAVDDDGDVFYAWTDGSYRHRIARSGDGGRTWTTTVVSGEDLASTTFPFVIAGEDGRVATGFLGATGGEPGNPGDVGPEAVWHLHLATSLDADAPEPRYDVVRVTPQDDPVMIGCLGRHGGACRVPGHDNLLDFNDVALTPDGRLAISYVDACLPPRCTDSATSTGDRGHLAIQTAGPRLRRPAG